MLRKVSEEIERILSTKYEISEIITIDGVKIILEDDSWILLRPSGTEPVFRIFAESRNAERTNELINIGKRITQKVIESV